MNKVGIFGCAGFARECADIAYAMGLHPILIAYEANEKAALKGDYDCLLESELPANHTLPLAIGIGDNGVRQKIAERYFEREFINLIHPSATFGYQQRNAVDQQRGLIIAAGVRLTNQIALGDFCILNLNATIGHDCILDAFVNVAPGANISGNVHIQSGCWIGTNAAINQGSESAKLIIGENTIVGSGSVVTKPCDSNAVYAGVPAVRKK